MNKMTSERVAELGLKGATAYLRHTGCEILDTDWHSVAGTWDVVARDEDGIRFVTVNAEEFALPGAIDLYTRRIERVRAQWERRAIAWLDAHRDCTNVALSFDLVAVGLMGTDRAIIRHHKNVATAYSDDELRQRCESVSASSIDDDADAAVEIQQDIDE